MASEWKIVRLGDHVDASLGKMLDKNKNQGTLHPYLGNKQVRWGSFDLDDLSEMKFQDHEHELYGLKSGDLVVCEGGEPGRCALWKDKVPDMKIQKALHRIRPYEELDSTFLHYWFCYAGKFELLDPYFTGTTIKHLTGKAVAELPIPLPPLPEQKAIAHILGSLDDKIELNRRMNETLEGMAQALFKSWFVDFDPVIDNALAAGNPIPEEFAERAEVRRNVLAGRAEAPASPNSSPASDAAGATTLPEEKRRRALCANAKEKGSSIHNSEFITQHSPKALFPDSFQSSEIGPVPTGWNCGSILEKAKLLSGGTPKTSVSEYWDGDIPWASAKDVSQCGESFLINSARCITTDGLAKSSTKMIPGYSTVFVARGATTGRLTMFGDDMAMNQTCYGLRSDSEMHFYTYCHSRHFIDSIVNAGHGSIFTTITTKTFEASKVIFADEVIISEFEEFVSPTFQKVLSNQVKTRTLEKIRDTLLPKLISGELRIEDAEKMVVGR